MLQASKTAGSMAEPAEIFLRRGHRDAVRDSDIVKCRR